MFRPIGQVAARLGLRDVGPSGARAWGGHAIRRGGAQLLGVAGVYVRRIQALARHSGGAVLSYLDNAHAESSAALAGETSLRGDVGILCRDFSALRAALQRAPETRRGRQAPALAGRLPVSQRRLPREATSSPGWELSLTSSTLGRPGARSGRCAGGS